ncbi:unnamed protein product, partial [Prorocentrum cordatum]
FLFLLGTLLLVFFPSVHFPEFPLRAKRRGVAPDANSQVVEQTFVITRDDHGDSGLCVQEQNRREPGGGHRAVFYNTVFSVVSGGAAERAGMDCNHMGSISLSSQLP